MPIQRFRDFESARDALWLEPGSPRLVAKLRHVWELSGRLAKYPPPRGLWRFRDMEEAHAHREAWVTARVQRLADERSDPGPGSRGSTLDANRAVPLPPHST